MAEGDQRRIRSGTDAQRSAAERSEGQRPAGQIAAGEGPEAERPTAERVAGERPDERPAAGESEGERPARERSAHDSPAGQSAPPEEVAKSARSGKVTLRDVAAEAGVSIGTASNAFNRPDLISEGLRDRVFEAASRLGYGGPDPAARRLRTGRTGALGLIFTDRLPYAFDDEAAVLFLRGVANALENSGAGLLLIPTSPTREEGSRVVRGAAVDGFIVFSTPTGDPRLEAALARGLPTITVDEPFDVPTPFIGIDDRAGAEAAGRHLVELGHRRVAVISFPEYARDDRTLPFDVPRERLAGYRAALGEDFDPGLVFTAYANHPDTGKRLLAEMLEIDPSPTAVLVMSDALASGVVRGALEAGLRVPEDISVVGFDGVPSAALTQPPLTTVAQPTEQKGELTAQALLRALDQGASGAESGEPPQRNILPTELLVRGTTGPPPG